MSFVPAPPVGTAAAVVRAALAKPSLAAFRQHLLEAGFAFSIRGRSPTLAPLNGGRHIRLKRLHLRTAFWVRFCEWGEPFTSLGWTQDAPERLWRALADECLDAAQLESVRKFREALGDERVTEAMCIAARNMATKPVEARFRYFCGICWNWIKNGYTARSPHHGWHLTAVPAATSRVADSALAG